MLRPPAWSSRHVPVVPFLVAVSCCLVCPLTVDAQGTPGPNPLPVGVNFSPFVRGDANADLGIDLADPVRILTHLFAANPLECMDAGDANDDDLVDISDAVFVISYLFTAGAAPGSPFPDCGPDPTNGSLLGCDLFDGCAVDREQAHHVLRRIAYGPTPTELADVEANGVLSYITAQLDPFSIPENPAVDLRIQAYPIIQGTPSSYVNYYRHVLIRGRYSNRQLLEQMTDFWSNHFNTYFWTVRGFLRNLDGGSVYDGGSLPDSRVAAMELESAEDDAYRANALGTFEDLLTVSATSPTMLIYLDNISNIASDPNENYAREILELSTVGVNGGYTQDDVEELARCFTGWTICKVAPADVGDPHAPCLANNHPTGVWSFHFDPANHDYDAKTLFPTTSYPLSIPARAPGSLDGVLDGFEVIAHLSTTAQTAEYVSTKLIQKFVSDEVPPALVAACIGTWLSTGGNMQAVMETILTSPQFLDDVNYRWNKVKTPMETLLSTVRSLEGETTNANQMRIALGNLQHLPLNQDTPDGYPELGNDWIGTSKIVDTIHFNEIIYQGSGQLNYDPRPIQVAAGVGEANPTEVVTFWLELMFPGGYNSVDEAIALDFFSTDDSGAPLVLQPGTAAYDSHVRKFLTFLRSWPQAMKQ